MVLGHVLLLSLISLSTTVDSQSIIKTLPGFHGDLPFYLETGYVGVGEREELQFFYYLFESERNPKDDPLVLWFSGGPGCSVLSAIVYQNGPLIFDYANSTGNIPSLMLRPYYWTKVANILYLDTPVGTGFSYSTTWEGYKTGNDKGSKPRVNLKGLILGNPLTDFKYDLNSRIAYAHQKELISNKLYQSTKKNCKGEYLSPDRSNKLCINNLQAINKTFEQLYLFNIMEPKCSTWNLSSFTRGNELLATMKKLDVLTQSKHLTNWCRDFTLFYSYIWANDKNVQSALHVREGTIKEWPRCNLSLWYKIDVRSSLQYQKLLTNKGHRVLIFSGDQDLAIPYLGTLAWIHTLNLTITDDWRPWLIDDQIAGFVITYSKGKYNLTFATVKGGGHTASEIKPKEAFVMIDRWFAYHSL
ncbi:serine carboxypeptidase-like 17 isoform X2 [Manihot esculenta]|uniref:serine carboxypeptidase-like 17 isoform X2 n=1 Tax=Manihot esculenta TaxID=3983 RepID=UPI000B5D69FC|nr:serine carboxypeptidase-like 17 isoform X2 [Manihot esculenta]